MRRIVLAAAAAILALVLLYPVVCAGSEYDPVRRCKNVLGLSLPGFSYRNGQEYRIYLVPLAGMALAAVAAWWLARPREATWRS